MVALRQSPDDRRATIVQAAVPFTVVPAGEQLRVTP
jgi:hypothetical protein